MIKSRCFRKKLKLKDFKINSSEKNKIKDKISKLNNNFNNNNFSRKKIKKTNKVKDSIRIKVVKTNKITISQINKNQFREKNKNNFKKMTIKRKIQTKISKNNFKEDMRNLPMMSI